MPAIFNIPDQYNGDTFEEVRFNFYVNSVSEETKDDLSNAVPKIQIKNKKDLSTVVVTLTISNGLAWINQSEGQFKISIANPIDWGAGTYVYDLQITDSGTTPSTVKTYLKGEIKVLSEITT
jgi:hypothetical protein